MAIMQKWNFKTRAYEPHEVPDDKIIVLYSYSLSLPIHCANCFKDMQYGDGYTSLTIHSVNGFGYPVCEACYNDESQDRTNHKEK